MNTYALKQQKLRRNKIITFVCLIIAIFMLSAAPGPQGSTKRQGSNSSSDKVTTANKGQPALATKIKTSPPAI